MARKRMHTDYQIRWENFRRFEDTGWITIKPLTILLGANNGGKSSIMSPLLLLAQTRASHDSDAPLVPNGRLIDLGSYKDFIHQHQVERKLKLNLRFHTHVPPVRKKLKDVGSYAPGGLELAFVAEDDLQQMRLERYAVTDIYNREYFAREREEAGFSLKGAVKVEEFLETERKALSEASPINFLFSPNDVLYGLDRHSSDNADDPEPFSNEFSHYLKAAGFAYSSVRNVLDNLSYVGPLRTKLQRFYRVSPETPETVGPQGEYAASLYRRKVKELKPDIDRWVKAFEFGDELRYQKLTEDLFQLVFASQDGEQTNIADAGFGASQVLPLIIQAVAAPKYSLTLAEQPEIHLNPRLQCVLADLFVQMATSGHRVLIETHSEHLILRLRRLVAEKKINADEVSLYFVEKDGSKSTIREIPINSSGSIDRSDWPKGFFEDSLRESLALATAQAKSAARKVARKNNGTS